MESREPHPRFELISFDLCPYVQRSVITLLHKKVEHKITFIDLRDKPAWFLKLSPMGKVPVLLVRESEGQEPTVLFESAIINEYIDEVTPPSVAPKNPLQKARERAWVEVGGELLMALYQSMNAADHESAEAPLKKLWSLLSHVEEALPAKAAFFRGSGFSLVDSAFAPVFMRLFLVRPLRDDSRWKSLPKCRAWAEHLLSLPEVQNSVIPEFKAKTQASLKAKQSHWANEVV
jgi:glutathione S-transferase